MRSICDGEEIYREGDQGRACAKPTHCHTRWFLSPAVPLTSNKGVQKLLDAIVDYMPSPLDIKAIKGVNPDTEEEESRRPSDDDALLRAGL